MKRVVSWFAVALATLGMLSPRVMGQPSPVQERGNVKLFIRSPAPQGNPQIGVTELLKLSVEIKGPLEVELPQTLTSTVGWREWQRSAPKYLRIPQGEVSRQTFELAALAPGDFSVELTPWKVRKPSAAWETITWTPLTVRVVATLKDADPKSLRDITAIETVPGRPVSPPEWPWWWLGFGAAAALAATGGCLLFIRRTGVARATMSAEQLALTRLDRLAKLPQRSAVRRVHAYGLLANLVRSYLARRFEIPARRRTTDELVEHLKTTAVLSASTKTWIAELLQHCDGMRFAGRPVVEEEWASWVMQTRRFLRAGPNYGENEENA